MEAFGEVRDVEIKVDPQTGVSRGFGFVLFANEESVTAVVNSPEHHLGKKRPGLVQMVRSHSLN